MEVVNFFAGSTLNRCNERRTDNKYLNDVICRKDTKYVICKKCEPLCTGRNATEKRLAIFAYEDVKPFVDFNIKEKKWPSNLLFLGIDTNKVNWFAVNIKNDETSLDELLTEDLCFLQGYQKAVQIAWDESAILSQAQAMFHWHDRYRFCATCGSNMFVEEAGYKRTCVVKDCRSNKGIHNTCYPRTDPVVIMNVISKDGKNCLLGRKGRWPDKMYSCLAGFLEPGESIEDAVRRETTEESGITVENIRYISSQPWPFPSSLMIGCQATATSESIHVNKEELEDAKWFDINVVRKACQGDQDELYIPPKETIAGQLIRQWIDEESTSPLNSSL